MSSLQVSSRQQHLRVTDQEGLLEKHKIRRNRPEESQKNCFELFNFQSTGLNLGVKQKIEQTTLT